MIISEFGKPITAKSLNESLARRFGQKIALENFTLEQLQDARNKMRTRLSQIEMSESFNKVVEGDDYQKSKLFLDVLNAELSERGDIEDESLEEGGKPDFPDIDGDGDTKEPMKKAAKDKKDAGKGKGSKPKKGKVPPQFQKESVVREGAEDNAEIIMAAKDMVDRVTGWMEDTAEMQTESMLELGDAIRDEMGVDQAGQFVQGIKPALEGLYTAMEQAREALSAGVGMLTGEAAPAPTMGAEEPPMEEPGMEPTVDMEEPLPAEGDVAPAAAGGEEPLGRATRESIDPRKLARTLSKKK
mgnify:CR=1 FL=1